jgi:hypothetical protein
VQQLVPLAFNLDAMRRSVEQLAAKQDQMAQNIATLQAIEEDIRQKMSSTPPSPPQQAASIPQPKLPQRLVHILGIARAAPPRLRRKDVFVWKLRGELGDKPPSDPMRFVVRRGVGHPVGFWKQRPWRGRNHHQDELRSLRQGVQHHKVQLRHPTNNGGANSGGASDDGASPSDDGANPSGGGANPNDVSASPSGGVPTLDVVLVLRLAPDPGRARRAPPRASDVPPRRGW